MVTRKWFPFGHLGAGNKEARSLRGATPSADALSYILIIGRLSGSPTRSWHYSLASLSQAGLHFANESRIADDELRDRPHLVRHDQMLMT